jgi:hypothetical protein
MLFDLMFRHFRQKSDLGFCDGLLLVSDNSFLHRYLCSIYVNLLPESGHLHCLHHETDKSVNSCFFLLFLINNCFYYIF